MRLALAEAQQAAAEGEVPVGAVVVHCGRVIAAEHNRSEQRRDLTAHAELLAMQHAARQLGGRLAGCTLYVTLEPCAMCAGAIVHARLDGVVYGCRDALAGAVVSRSDLLDAPFLNHRVWHMGGVLSGECAALIRTFFAKRR